MRVAKSQRCILLACAVTPIACAASPSTWTVTSTGSGGQCTANSVSDANCTLDVAIADTSAGDTIYFSSTVQGHTIPILGNNALTAGITIDASPNGVTLDGGSAGNIFYFSSGTFLLSHLILENGLGNNSGGAIYNAGADLTVDSCTFENNVATAFGGAIYNGGSLLLINSTLSGNMSGSEGGAIAGFGGNLAISNSTFTGNSSAKGGAIYATGLSIMSSIVAGNTATGGSQPDISSFGGPGSLGYDVIGNADDSHLTAAAGDQFGTAASPVDPLFETTSAAYNGGATPTFALKSSSPARQAGNCSGNANSSPAIPAIALDQSGQTRSTPCTAGAFDMTAIFYSGFEF